MIDVHLQDGAIAVERNGEVLVGRRGLRPSDQGEGLIVRAGLVGGDATLVRESAASWDAGWDDSQRPAVLIVEGELHRQLDAAWSAVAGAQDEREPHVMVRGNELVRITERGELEGLTRYSLREELARTVNFLKPGGRNQPDKSTDPPLAFADHLLARDSAEYVGARRAESVVDVPVLTPDGTLITEPGLHPSGIYYRPAPGLEDVVPPVPELVSEVEAARDLLLNDLLGDFEFAGPADRANALGLVLLPFVLDYLGDANTPMHMIHGAQPGMGKTLCMQAALMPGCGRVELTAEARDDDEWRKRITAKLLAGRRAIVFDNLKRALDSGAVANALTSGVWSDRVLGASRDVALPIRNLWGATGNKPRLSQEQADRTVSVLLALKEDSAEVPRQRPKSAFRHPDLLSWAVQHRPELVCAALTLVRHWAGGDAIVTEGGHTFERTGWGPPPGDRTLGSYERWAQVIGGMVTAADVPGFLDNRDQLREADEETQEARAFLGAWLDTGLGPTPVSELANLCDYGAPLHEVVPTRLLEGPAHGFNRRLGNWLRDNGDRRFGDLQLVGQEGPRVKSWYVRRH